MGDRGVVYIENQETRDPRQMEKKAGRRKLKFEGSRLFQGVHQNEKGDGGWDQKIEVGGVRKSEAQAQKMTQC